jgi:type VI secretion system secreted protein VgrG
VAAKSLAKGAAAAGGNYFRTGLGDEVDRIAAKSPTFQAQLKELKGKNWHIYYGPEKSLSVIDRKYNRIKINGSEKGTPAGTVRALTHEVGHAQYPYKPDYSSKAAYLNEMHADEGAAMLNNIKIQREILANGGPNIDISGNPANTQAYNAIYDQYLKDGNAAAARTRLGELIGSKERLSYPDGQTYDEYFGEWYDKAYGGR